MRQFDLAAIGGDRGDRGGVVHFDFAGQRGESLGQFVRLPGETAEIARSAVDGAPALDRGEHRGLVDRFGEAAFEGGKLFHSQPPYPCRSACQRACHGDEVFHRERFGSSRRVDSERIKRFDCARNALQTLAQHLAPLAERGLGHALELARVRPLRASRRVRDGRPRSSLWAAG